MKHIKTIVKTVPKGDNKVECLTSCKTSVTVGYKDIEFRKS